MDFNNLSVSSLQSNSCNVETNVGNENVEVRWDPKIGPVSYFESCYRLSCVLKV